MPQIPRLLAVCGILVALILGSCRSPAPWAFRVRDARMVELPAAPAGTLATPHAERTTPWLQMPVAQHHLPSGPALAAPQAEPIEVSHPLLLADVLQMALANSPDLHAARERVAIAEATLARARAELYPQVSFSEQYTITNNPAFAFSSRLNQMQFDSAGDLNQLGTVDNFHTQLLWQQRLYSGERRSAQRRAAGALESAARYDLAAARNELVFATAEAYYRLLQARDLVLLTSEAVVQVEEHLRIARAREAADTAMRSDVLTVELRLAEVQQAKIAAENRLRLCWAVLCHVTGAEISPGPLPLEIPAAPWSGRMESLQAALAQAAAQRPELSAMAGRGQAAHEDIRAAQADKRPVLDLLADYDIFTGDWSHANDSGFVGLMLKWNLFDGGRTASEVARATARLRELKAHERRLWLDIELDVQQSCLALRDAQERRHVAGHAIGRAEQNLHEIEQRYRSEMATTAELLDAQLALTEARVREATAAAEVQIATVSLERALGNLCDRVLDER